MECRVFMPLIQTVALFITEKTTTGQIGDREWLGWIVQRRYPFTVHYGRIVVIAVDVPVLSYLLDEKKRGFV